MLSRPRLRGCFEVVAHRSGELFLLDESRQFIFQGPVYVDLAPLLDGRRGLGELVEAAQPHPPHEVLLALGHLEGRGCLVDGPPEGCGPEAAWSDSLPGVPPEEVHAPLRTSVRSVGEGGFGPAMEAALLKSGVGLSDEADVEIVVADDYLRPELHALNREFLERGRPWLLVKPVGLVPWIGPLFLPGTTGCWSCLAQRLRSNRQMEKYVADRSKGGPRPYKSRGALPSSLDLALDLAVSELLRFHLRPQGTPRLATGPSPFVRPESPSLVGRLLSFDLLARTLREHDLVRRPQCPDCGEGMPAASSRIVLQSAPKIFRGDGGHRTLTPAETFERYKHHISPITGAVTDLRPALGKYDNELTPAFVAGHNFAMGVDSVLFLKDSLRGMSGGKGASAAQAKVSGLCEALERYSGLFFGDESARRGSLESLGETAIHPNRCMGFSEAQYSRRGEGGGTTPFSRYTMVPNPFDPRAEVDWTPVWSLTHGAERLLPTAYCYYGHPEFAQRWCMPDSNGCASGNTLEEAILQAYMELVERDAVALWWYNRIPRAEVDLDSFGIGYLLELREHYARIGRSLHVLDISSDFGANTLACVSGRTSGPTEDLLVGFGAHFDPRIALLRAVTEVNQFLPSVSYTRPDGSTIYLFGDDLATHWWRTARISELDYLRPDPAAPKRKASDFRDISTDDLAKDVELCVDQAREKGLEVLVLDQTRPDIGLRVVRVAIPGICHFWRRFGHRRLYEVPLSQGWLKAPLGEDQLNPHTIFF
jgi:ribosomal protein S12 methylthiotransferase accessory factor